MSVSVRRDHLWYAGAIIAGFVSVPLVGMANPVPLQFFESALVEAVFAVTVVGVLVTTYSLLRDDLSHITLWTGVRVAVLLLLIPFAFASGILMYEGQTSWAGENAHWHMSFAVVVDGESYELIDPERYCGDDYACKLGNHTGPVDFHEHNDMRIHLHGPVPDRESATLSAFFDGLGGTLTATELRFPTNDGWVNVTESDDKTLKLLVHQRANGRWCVIGGVPAEQQCTDPHNEQYAASPDEYVLSPYRQGTTDKLFIVYDNVSVADALEDAAADDRYRNVAAE